MDVEARRRLVEKALAIIEDGNTLLAVSLDEFFEGNSDEASIGVNLVPEQHVGLSGYRRALESIRRRPDVQDVFLELTEIPDLNEPADDVIWPTACVAFIVTTAALPEVKEWVDPLYPRSVEEGWCVQPGVKVPLPDAGLLPGMRPVRVWLL